MDTFPTKEVIAGQLRELIKGRKTREEISAWATTYVVRDDSGRHHFDRAAWDVLTTLVGADTKVDMKGTYLYFEEDFRDWLRDLENG